MVGDPLTLDLYVHLCARMAGHKIIKLHRCDMTLSRQYIIAAANAADHNQRQPTDIVIANILAIASHHQLQLIRHRLDIINQNTIKTWSNTN